MLTRVAASKGRRAAALPPAAALLNALRDASPAAAAPAEADGQDESEADSSTAPSAGDGSANTRTNDPSQLSRAAADAAKLVTVQIPTTPAPGTDSNAAAGSDTKTAPNQAKDGDPAPGGAATASAPNQVQAIAAALLVDTGSDAPAGADAKTSTGAQALGSGPTAPIGSLPSASDSIAANGAAVKAELRLAQSQQAPAPQTGASIPSKTDDPGSTGSNKTDPTAAGGLPQPRGQAQAQGASQSPSQSQSQSQSQTSPPTNDNAAGPAATVAAQPAAGRPAAPTDAIAFAATSAPAGQTAGRAATGTLNAASALPNFGFVATNGAALPPGPATAASSAVPISGLAVTIAAHAQAGANRFDIRLDPPELGRIDVHLAVDSSGQVTSHVTVDRPDTLQLLQSQQPQLQHALEQAGLKTADNGLQFTLRDQSFAGQNGGSGNGGAQGRAAQLVIPDAERAPVAATEIYSRLRLRGGVDIRV